MSGNSEGLQEVRGISPAGNHTATGAEGFLLLMVAGRILQTGSKKKEEERAPYNTI